MTGAEDIISSTGLEPYEGPWERRQMLHLLRRTTFGNAKRDLKRLGTMSVTSAVEYLLRPELPPAPPVNEYQRLKYDPDVPEGQTWIHADWNMDVASSRVQSVNNWWVNLIHHQSTSIHMKMMVFWSSLFTTSHFSAGTGKLPYYYSKLLFDHALGNYREFLKAYTIEPMTLKYLNGNVNIKNSPDENYARELQELFTIGKGPDSHYTEDDVVAAARVLTGWRYNWPQHNTHFQPYNHDTGDKQFSSFYDNHVIRGRAGLDGALETDELLDMLVSHSECARYLARRLYTFFVSPEINESAEQNVIGPLAEVLRENQFEIVPALRTLLSSAHFFDEANRGRIIKSPLDFIQGTFRTFDVKFPSNLPLHEKFQMERAVWWLMDEQGFKFGDPPSVAGWPAYYQVPVFDKSWATANTVALRGLRSDSLIYWGFWTPVHLLNIDILGFFNEMEDPADPVGLISELLEFALGYDEVDAAVNNSLKTILLSGNLDDYYWTDAWTAYKQDPNNGNKRGVVETRLKRLLQVVLQMAEYQLH